MKRSFLLVLSFTLILPLTSVSLSADQKHSTTVSPNGAILRFMNSHPSARGKLDRPEAYLKFRKAMEEGSAFSEHRLLKSISENLSDPYIMEEYGQYWNGSAWVNDRRWLYTYDSAGNLIEEVRQQYSGGVWVNDRRWIDEYDSAGNNTLETRQNWNGSAWESDFRWIDTYDNTGKLTHELIESWDGSAWDHYSEWTYTYNGSGDLLEELEQRISGVTLTNYSRYTYTYGGNLLQIYARDVWADSVWDPIFYIEYTHDGSGNILTETRHDWINTLWRNSWRWTYEYDSHDNDTSELFENWISSSWLPSDLHTYHYDENDYWIEWIHQFYSSGWNLDWEGLFSYYSDGRWKEDVWYTWNGSSWDYDEKYYPVWGKLGGGQLYAVQDKWNMVSVPLTLGDYTKTSVYPTAVSSAFAFTTQYESRDILENGVGYWVKFDGSQSVSMNGAARPVDTFAVAAGWTMVGSVSDPVDVATITSSPPGMVASNFFEFTNGYMAATTIEPGKAYWVKLSQAGSLILDATGAAPAENRIRIRDTGEMPPPPPSDESLAVSPETFALEQNFPNPFNPSTVISYTLPGAARVTLVVYDVLGREVATLADGVQAAGPHELTFDASGLPAGVYMYTLRAGSLSRTEKMLLLK